MYSDLVKFIRELYPHKDYVHLHEPCFIGNERKYVLDAIDSTFVSSVGAYVDRFEQMMRDITGAKCAVAVVNGTAALHIALKLAGVKPGDLVITQPLTFIATCNAISYLNAQPLFIDVDKGRLGLSPDALSAYLTDNATVIGNGAVDKKSGQTIAACVPMHTFGFPAEIDRIVEICNQWKIPVIEDAAESLGSVYKNKQTGTFGLLGTYSFNGNKTVTAGGGGVIVTDDAELGKLAKHITTTAKVPHRWEFKHDQVGYNYRCPNINAALACAQLEQLDFYIVNKRNTATEYAAFFENSTYTFVQEQPDSYANYWLNTLILADKDEQTNFLTATNDAGIMTRPAWELMHRLPMFSSAPRGPINHSEWLADRIVNLPSSVRIK